MEIQPANTQLDALEQSALDQCEAVIEQGLRTFVDVGNALLTIRDDRLYRREYWTFEEYCEKRWEFSNRRANQFIEAAMTIATLGTMVPELAAPAVERQVRPLTSLPPEQQAAAWRRAVETAPAGRLTAAHVQGVIDDMQTPRQAPEDDPAVVKVPHVAHNSGNNEWYTPAEYIAAARAVMGDIELDPATTEIANEVVRATRYYTADNDGLSHDWRAATLWLNPPYASDLIGRFIDKLIAGIETAQVKAAIVLVNNATETHWFQTLAEYAAAVCFPAGRVKFWNPERESVPLQGQAIVYIGSNPLLFRSVFQDFGWTARL